MSHALNIASTCSSKHQRDRGRRYVPIILFRSVPTTTFIVDTTQQFPHTIAEGDLKDLNAEFIAVLDALSLDVQERGIDLRHYTHDYLHRLRSIGGAAYNHILPPTLQDYLRAVTRDQQRDVSLTFNADPALSLFWEMLYEDKPFGPIKPDKFWGFQYPLGRTYWGIDRDEFTPIQTGFFSSIHHKLACSRQEVDQLAVWIDDLCKRLNIPLNLHLLDQLIPLDTLSTEQIMELFHSEDFRYGVIHFACHCWNPTESGATQSYLSLTAHEHELEICLEKLMAWQNYGFVNRPFVFLNACESTTSGHLLQNVTLPSTMLKFGAGGVIATACTIPDNFASAFASEFYNRLLGRITDNRPPNIGEVLLETRIHFLEHYNNPLGLAYGLYAKSNQQLSLD